jgi:hypothetical protein
LASELFETLFSITQPPIASDQLFKDGLPVISIEAESADLKCLLMFCHPGKAPDVLGRLREVQSLAMMYAMLEVARRILNERTWGEVNSIAPIMLDTIKAKIGHNNSLFFAAVCALIFPTEDDVVELGLITQSQFDSLGLYRQRCCLAAASIAWPNHGHFKWIPDRMVDEKWFGEEAGHTRTRSCGRAGTKYFGNVQGKIQTRRWWMDYMEAAKEAMRKRPSGSSLTSGKLFDDALREGSNCSTCKPRLKTGLTEFAALFAGEVDKAVKNASNRAECCHDEII